MKTKPMLRWLFESSLNAFIGFYISMYAILLVSCIITFFVPAKNVSMNSFSVSPQVMLFITGIIQFYGATRFGLGHGVSRKSIYLSVILFFIVMSVLILPLNLLGEWLGSLAGMNTRPVETYFFLSTCDVNSRAFLLALMVERISSVFLCGTLGYFTGGIYYRLTTKWKWIVSIGVPVGLLVVLPLAVTYLFPYETKIALKDAIQRFVMQFLLKTPWNLALVFLLAAMFCAAACFLLIRKTPLKTAK